MPIGAEFNYQNVFMRDLTICVLSTLERKVRWNNIFSDVEKEVEVPFYYSIGRDERFLLDSFTDETVSQNRYVELNTDLIPRGHLTMKGMSVKSDAFANPNVWLKMLMRNKNELKRVLTKVRALPIRANYSLTIMLASEIDAFKCQQAILNTMWLYKYMYFEYSGMSIDAYMLIPDETPVEINRDNNLSSDTSIKLTMDFEVHTYYPAYDEEQIMQPPNGVSWRNNIYFSDSMPNGVVSSLPGSTYSGPTFPTSNLYIEDEQGNLKLIIDEDDDFTTIG